MASDTIEQMAEKIRTFAEDLIRDNFAPRDDTPAPFHAGQTVDAATAWEAMGFGWVVRRCDQHVVDACGGGRPEFLDSYLDGGDNVQWMDGAECGYRTKQDWLESHPVCEFTLVRIHPDAHKHAMQRLLAAGLKVGDRVEVVHHENGEGAHYEGWIRDHPVGSSATVKTPNWIGEHHVKLDTGYVLPAHCLRKLPAPNPEDQVPPATTTGEGEGAVDFEGDPSAETLPADSPTRWVPEPDKWYVWSREAGPPNVKHDTHAEAKAEAERLAAKHPGREFKVLGQVGENVVVQQQPRFEKGDRVLIPAVVVTSASDFEGDIEVAFARRGLEADPSNPRTTTYAAASALRPVAASEGGGE